jgi:phosphate-selective porin OprO and OprP
VPQGLNQLTSSNEITFIERSAINNVIADSRRLGIAYDYFNGPLGFKTMIFGRALGQRAALVDDMPLGLAFRGVFAPEIGGGILHIGASAVYENLMDNNIVRLRDRPEARDSKGGGIRLIDAVVPDAESTFKAGLELLFIGGPFSIEAEYLQATVNRSEGDNPTFNGIPCSIQLCIDRRKPLLFQGTGRWCITCRRCRAPGKLQSALQLHGS